MRMNLSVSDVKIFVPSKNFGKSLRFYRKLGWQFSPVDDGKLAELELGGQRFYLQNHYNKGWAQNFMFYLNVESAADWAVHAKSIIRSDDFAAAKVKGPAIQPHGPLVTHVWDPVGVLLHFAETLNEG